MGLDSSPKKQVLEKGYVSVMTRSASGALRMNSLRNWNLCYSNDHDCDVEHSIAYLGDCVCIVAMRMDVAWWNGDTRGHEVDG